jgi:protein phosphatase
MLELQASPTYSRFPFHERLRLSVELANLYIYQMSLKRVECSGMGATFTALGLFGGTAYFAQVGDSRGYVIRTGQVQQLTRDQSLVGQLVQAGHITEEEAERHTYKNVILQALGASATVNVEVDRLALRDMDIVLLCSDGLSNKVRPDEMRRIVEDSATLKEACDTLIELANARGGEDNITVMISQFAGAGLPSPERRAASFTAGLVADPSMQERWGAEPIPRDPELPYEIEAHLVDDEEDTLAPTENLKRVD